MKTTRLLKSALFGLTVLTPIFGCKPRHTASRVESQDTAGDSHDEEHANRVGEPDLSLASDIAIEGVTNFGSKLQNSGTHTLRVNFKNISRRTLINLRVPQSTAPFSMVYPRRGAICRNYTALGPTRACQFDVTMTSQTPGQFSQTVRFTYQLSGVRGTFTHDVLISGEVLAAAKLNANASLALGKDGRARS